MRISGSVFVVTGGSSGLGAATVQALVQRGARCINMDMQSPLYDNIPADSVFWTGKTDITDEQQVVDALKRGMDRLGGSSWSLRGVVNCAGFGTPGLTLKANGDPMPLEKFTRDINVNIVGSVGFANTRVLVLR
jgi:NAD(P)-dependent dehydrogenase (short-subunit alcohol dehydrogenase family)